MDYETFTREQIARLRAEADALEKNLKAFQAHSARVASAGSMGTTTGRPRTLAGSAFSAVMEAIEAAGRDGLTLNEMIEAARVEGHEVKRNTLRSQVWSAKEDGRLFQLDKGRYAVLNPALDFNTAARQDIEKEVDDGGGYGSGALGRTFRATETRGPRETFSADLDDIEVDLDDEIPF